MLSIEVISPRTTVESIALSDDGLRIQKQVVLDVLGNLYASPTR